MFPVEFVIFVVILVILRNAFIGCCFFFSSDIKFKIQIKVKYFHKIKTMASQKKSARIVHYITIWLYNWVYMGNVHLMWKGFIIIRSAQFRVDP